MYLLYRGTEKLTSVHTALYRYIQPVIAGILAITRGQAHFDAAKPTLLLIPMEGKPQMAQGALPKASLKEAIDKVMLGK